MLFNLKTDIVCDVLMKNELLLYMFVHIWTFWYDLTNVYYFVVLGNLFPSPGECNMYRWWSIPRNSYKFCIALITGNMVYERVINSHTWGVFDDSVGNHTVCTHLKCHNYVHVENCKGESLEADDRYKRIICDSYIYRLAQDIVLICDEL